MTRRCSSRHSATPTGWHLDNPYWSFSSRDSLSIWVALDDATRDNGCLYYLPGTHKTATWENAGIGQNQADLFKLYSQWRSIDSVGCPCPAGSAVFHNGLTAHGAGANMTSRPRRAMTCAYMPDGSTFNGNQNILPPGYFETLKVGGFAKRRRGQPLNLAEVATGWLAWGRAWRAMPLLLRRPGVQDEALPGVAGVGAGQGLCRRPTGLVQDSPVRVAVIADFAHGRPRRRRWY